MQSSYQNGFKNRLFGQKLSPESNPVSCRRHPKHCKQNTLFHTAIINSLDANIGNRCKIWLSTGPLFWLAEKYINYFTNLKGCLGKISRIFWGTKSGQTIVLAEPKTRFYNSGYFSQIWWLVSIANHRFLRLGAKVRTLRPLYLKIL